MSPWLGFESLTAKTCRIRSGILSRLSNIEQVLHAIRYLEYLPRVRPYAKGIHRNYIFFTMNLSNGAITVIILPVIKLRSGEIK